METFWNILTYALIFLGVWCALIAYGTAKIMKLAKETRGTVRRADKMKLWLLLGHAVAIAFVLFIYPGLIYTAPSAVACLEVATLPVLFHLSETQFKNWRRLKKSVRVA